MKINQLPENKLDIDIPPIFFGEILVILSEQLDIPLTFEDLAFSQIFTFYLMSPFIKN